jgi:hypothetical protein
MEVQYQYTLDDLKALARALPFSQRVRPILSWIVLVVACGVPPSVLLAASGAWRGVIAGWATLGAMCLFVAAKVWSARRRFWRTGLQRWQFPRTVRLHPDRLEVESDYYWGRRDWSLVARVVDTPKHVILFVNKVTAHVIPKRAFDSPAAADLFAQTAASYQQQARALATPRFTPNHPPVVNDADALQISYKNKAEEFISVQYDSLQRADQSQTKQNRVTIVALVASISVCVALYAVWAAGLGQVIGGSLTFALVGFYTALLAQRLARRRAVHNVEKDRLRPRTLTISPTGVADVEANRESFTTWRQFDSVEHDDRFIVLYYVNRQIGYLIPKSAFAAREDAERFANLARAYSEDASRDAAPETPRAAETGNPYQPPASA